MEQLEKAIIFATKKHNGKKRKATNIPYITHPIECVAITSRLTNDMDVLIAAVLHDTVEDGGVTIEEISTEFGKDVAMLVQADTENKRTSEPAEKTWKIRKEETIHFLKEKATQEEAIIILADKLSNLRSLYHDYTKIGDRLWERFNIKEKSEHKWYYQSIANALKAKLSDTDEYREMCSLIEKIF